MALPHFRSLVDPQQAQKEPTIHKKGKQNPQINRSKGIEIPREVVVTVVALAVLAVALAVIAVALAGVTTTTSEGSCGG